MANREIRRRASIGSSSLIVIFIVLCLVTFGVLSLGNAKGDSLLAERNAKAVQEYYRADGVGEEFVQKVDQAMRQASGTDISAVKQAVLAELGDYYREDDGRFCTEVAMQAGQALRIELEPDWEQRSVRILTWKVYNQEDYEIDQSIRVWDGN